MDESPFVIGIDLGTTNTAMAFCDMRSENPECKVFEIPQIVSEGEIALRATLPSFVYIPGEHELAEGSLELPWGEYSYAVGEFAREQGGRVPHRLVSSAKSWLCHSGVDRENPILPWTADSGEVNKISPVEASMRYLMHLSESWHTGHKSVGEERFAGQSIFLTVPASFDAVARELTVKAAIASDLDVILLEEPQAALYSWLHSVGDEWRNLVKVGDTILVCDVGGGTTDFSLIAVAERDGSLELERIAVGDHILLGGDNMDLALAMAVAQELREKEGVKLDSWQLNALALLCRSAKEAMFSDPSMEERTLVIPSRGSKLFASSVTAVLSRQLLNRVVIDGFLPETPLDHHPVRKIRQGLTEIGLPYEPEPSIIAHMARFLSLHRNTLRQRGASEFPNAILLNGGVFKSKIITERILSVIRNWYGDSASSVKLLDGGNLDLAVCRGAAYYGLARRGKGVRIRGGTSRSYYIGIESSMPAVPGFAPPLKALCLAPQGIEEGTHVPLPQREFGLVIGDDAEFRILSSSVRGQDAVGDMIEEWDDELTELPSLKTSLASTEEAGKVVPVTLETHVTEIGTIELWCVSKSLDKKWKLEFDIRKHDEPLEAAG